MPTFVVVVDIVVVLVVLTFEYLPATLVAFPEEGLETADTAEGAKQLEDFLFKVRANLIDISTFFWRFPSIFTIVTEILHA